MKANVISMGICLSTGLLINCAQAQENYTNNNRILSSKQLPVQKRKEVRSATDDKALVDNEAHAARSASIRNAALQAKVRALELRLKRLEAIILAKRSNKNPHVGVSRTTQDQLDQQLLRDTIRDVRMRK